jgi:cytochrome b involved in lipid metabolism|eukprot:334167-Prymnesium_polylepis.1
MAASAAEPTRWPRYTLQQVSQHCRKDDAWIVVGDCVYDITPHVVNHEGWTEGGKQSTLLAILCAMGQDCTDDFTEVHSDAAMRMLPPFQIGVLDKPNTSSRRMRFRTWEQLEEAGAV